MKKLVLIVMSLCLAVTMWGQKSPGSEWSLQVKQAATMIKEDPAKASEAFDELLKGKNKKNAFLLVEIGRAYLDQGKTAEAAEYAQRAKDINSKCAVAYLLSGDIALAMSAADSRTRKKHRKHRKPRTQRNPGRHRKHDDLPGYPRNHLLPM